MSTEHPQYSTNNQADKIQEYALRRNIEIVRTYADEGKSGLSLNGRASLQKLISDAESGAADLPWCWSMTSAAGAGFKMLTRRWWPMATWPSCWPTRPLKATSRAPEILSHLELMANTVSMEEAVQQQKGAAQSVAT